jgi:hypothetical protein
LRDGSGSAAQNGKQFQRATRILDSAYARDKLSHGQLLLRN